MGLLSLGTPLPWEEARKLAHHVREHGIIQFLHLWRAIKDRHGDKLLWGDEIEYIVVSLDEQDRAARLSLRQAEILRVLGEAHRETAESVGEATARDIPTFHPEYGRFMLESTPGSPYGASPVELRQVESNMRLRRKIARSHLRPNELPITLTSYPLLGAIGPTHDQVFTDPPTRADGPASQSLFLSDEIINPHARFPTLTANIRKRRGSKVAINMPIFHDEKTPRPFIDPSIPRDRALFPGDREAGPGGAAKPDHIYMDAMGFGMGCCCLQVTFQACSVQEARTIYDQLIPVAPLMMALTAASPAYRGYLADVDCRWNVISAAVDDRTEEERGLKPLKDSRMVMQKSRYDSVDSYISNESANRPEYNDNPLPIDEDIKKTLMEQGGIDELLANHLAHLFIRDPLVIFSEMVDLDDAASMDHFENIQSTNWQTLRFKPPPLGGQIGWRVEFRSMEVQITDFENAAFSIFVVLLTRAILSFGLNFYLPISKVDANMQRAHRRDAVAQEKFFFRKEVFRQRRRHGNTAPSGAWGTRSRQSSVHHTPSQAEEERARSTTSRRDEQSRERAPNGSSAAAASNATSALLRSALANGMAGGAGASGGQAQEQQQQRAASPSSRPHSTRSSRAASPELVPVEDEYDEFTMDELINGKVSGETGSFGASSSGVSNRPAHAHPPSPPHHPGRGLPGPAGPRVQLPRLAQRRHRDAPRAGAVPGPGRGARQRLADDDGGVDPAVRAQAPGVQARLGRQPGDQLRHDQDARPHRAGRGGRRGTRVPPQGLRREAARVQGRPAAVICARRSDSWEKEEQGARREPAFRESEGTQANENKTANAHCTHTFIRATVAFFHAHAQALARRVFLAHSGSFSPGTDWD